MKEWDIRTFSKGLITISAVLTIIGELSFSGANCFFRGIVGLPIIKLIYLEVHYNSPWRAEYCIKVPGTEKDVLITTKIDNQ